VTRKEQLLVQKQVIECIHRWDQSICFCTAHHFNQPQNPVLCNVVQSTRHSKSATSHGVIYSSCNTCSLDPPNAVSHTASDQFSCFHTAHSRVPILYNVC